MDKIALTATARDMNSTPSALRRNGQVPCVIYGNAAKHELLQCNEQQLKSAYIKAGVSTLVELSVDGKVIPVLFQALAQHPVSDRFEHVDFYAVDMKKELEAEVALRFEGEAPAVKDLGGILVTPMTHVNVRCLPTDLPHNLTIDISSLKEFHATITVGDIKAPKGVTITDDVESVVATVQEPRAEEVATPATPAEGAAPAAEGAAPAAGAAPAGDASKEEKKK